MSVVGGAPPVRPDVVLAVARSTSDEGRAIWKRYTRTVLAVFGGEADLDDLMLPRIFDGCPTDTGMSFGTDRLLTFPINTKLTTINALVGVSLSLHIATSGTNHFYPVLLLTADQD